MKLEDMNPQQIVITLAVILLTLVILPALRTWLKSKTSAEQNNALLSFIEELVKAAEQTFRPGDTLTPEALNALKKSYVVREVGKYARRQGIPFTDDQLDALIEAAVYGLKWWGRSVTVSAE